MEHDASIAGAAPAPWTRLGLGQWTPPYPIPDTSPYPPGQGHDDSWWQQPASQVLDIAADWVSEKIEPGSSSSYPHGTYYPPEHVPAPPPPQQAGLFGMQPGTAAILGTLVIGGLLLAALR